MRTLVGQLQTWQRREWLYRAAWGFARWVAVAFVGVSIACAIDWFIDRTEDTPLWVRILLTGTQLALYLAAAYLLLVRLRVPSLDALASKAEESVPEFGHRLVTALQLNRNDAKTAGMSKQLIAAVTDEAETMSARHQLAKLADGSRFLWGLALLVPLALVAAAIILINPQMITALLARQLLLDVDIPHKVEVKNVTRELWPSGDAVELKFEVTGLVEEGDTGTAYVKPQDQPGEPFSLTRVSKPEETPVVFTATLPPSSSDFTVTARAAGGRTRKHSKIRFEPRPVVKELSAWVQLPKFVDPEGQRRFERFQPQGEVFAYAGSGLRIETTVSKPVKSATVVVFNRDDKGQEQAALRIPMTLSEDRQTASAQFDLPVRPIAYRIEVIDDNDFANLNPPRRGITLAADEPPRVSLLSEVLKDPKEEGPLDDFEVNGMPLVLGGRVQVGYSARSPLGLKQAFIVYRINDGDWRKFPLSKTQADPAKVGKFIPELGVFQESGEDGQVEFFTIPAANPEVDPPGIEAGGRYNFQTANLEKKNPDGSTAKLETGDRVEFLVEVHDRNPLPNRHPGRSESRIKVVVTDSQYRAWINERNQSRERLRQIEEKQRGVFGRRTAS